MNRGKIEVDASDGENEARQVSKKTKLSAQPDTAVLLSSNKQQAIKNVPFSLENISLDVFSQIASRLLAEDVLSLARTSKSFRKVLMSRSSTGVWRAAISNVKGLPPCPSTVSEPRYTAFVFTLPCTVCGRALGPRPIGLSTYFLVRLCNPCNSKEMMFLKDVRIAEVKKAFPPYISSVLRSKVDEETRIFQDITASGDTKRLEVWKKEKEKEMAQWSGPAHELDRFISQQRQERDQREETGKDAALRERHAEIQRRLEKLGWTEEDMVFPKKTEHQWIQHRSHNTPLTDRHWEKIKPKLIALLEANRKSNPAAERREARRARLRTLWDNIKSELAFSTNRVPSQTLVEAITAVSRTVPVPEFSDIAKLPTLKKLIETDAPISEMETNFVQCRAEVDRDIDSWSGSIKASLAEVLHRGLAESGYTLDSPIVGTITNNLPNNPFESLSPDTQLLIRADSISLPHSNSFHHRQSEPPFRTFDALMSSIRQHLDQGDKEGLEQPLDTTRFKVHPIAPAIVRAFIKCLGRSTNTSILELQTLDERFICGRCQDDKPKTWLEMIKYYIERADVWKDAERRKPWFAKHNIAMHDIHDLYSDRSEPLIRLLTPEERAALENTPVDSVLIAGKHGDSSYALMCGPCLRSFVYQKLTTRPRLIQHLRDVHEIAEPLLDDPKADLPEVKNHNFQTVWEEHLEDGEYAHDDYGDDPWWASSEEGEEDGEDDDDDEEAEEAEVEEGDDGDEDEA